VFSANSKQEKSIEQLGEWEYLVKGQIQATEKDVLFVDCGGIVLPLEGLTHDARCLGEWVGFKIDRLDAHLCEE
jgi:hypothetical protein